MEASPILTSPSSSSSSESESLSSLLLDSAFFAGAAFFTGAAFAGASSSDELSDDSDSDSEAAFLDVALTWAALGFSSSDSESLLSSDEELSLAAAAYVLTISVRIPEQQSFTYLAIRGLGCRLLVRLRLGLLTGARILCRGLCGRFGCRLGLRG